MNGLQELNDQLTSLARAGGAALTGYTRIRRSQPVVILAFPYSDVWFFKYPYILTKRFGEVYYTSRHVQNMLGSFLKKAGFGVEYKTVLSVFGDFRPLAVAAGLGNWGRNGLVVNKSFGSGLLFAALFTDAPLATALQQPAEEHCSNCGACQAACPAGAFGAVGFRARQCLKYAVKGCAECLKTCRPPETKIIVP